MLLKEKIHVVGKALPVNLCSFCANATQGRTFNTSLAAPCGAIIHALLCGRLDFALTLELHQPGDSNHRQ